MCSKTTPETNRYNEAPKQASCISLPGFLVKEYFSSKGYDGEGCRIEYLREICEGVLPGKLYKIVSKYKNIDDRFGGDWGEFEMTKKTGKEYAQGDVLVGNGPRMLEIFLTGELDELEQDNGTPDDPSAG